MKILFGTVFLCVLSFAAVAQSDSSVRKNQHEWSLGLDGGVTRNYLITNISSLSFSQLLPLSAYSVGLPVQYRFNDWFALFADPGMLKKNYEFARTGFFQGETQSQLNTYLQLPLMARFTFGGKRLKGFLNLGGYGAWWAAGRVKGTTANLLDPTGPTNLLNIFAIGRPYSFNEPYEFSNVRDQRFEWGVIAGAGISWQLSGALQVFVEARNTRSLTDQQKAYERNEVPKYNQTFSLLAGGMVKLKSISDLWHRSDKSKAQ